MQNKIALKWRIVRRSIHNRFADKYIFHLEVLIFILLPIYIPRYMQDLLYTQDTC